VTVQTGSRPGEPGDGIRRELPAHVADHLRVELRRAVAWNKPVLFADCVGWAKAALIGAGVPASELARHLEHLTSTMRRQPAGDAEARAEIIVSAALRALPDLSAEQVVLSPTEVRPSPLATLYFRALLRGDRQLASQLVLQSVKQGTPVKHIYLHVFQPAQHEIGRLWQLNRISVAEEHYCTAATQLIMSQLYPHVFSSQRIGRTVVAACVSGDLHELGARMVADFFEMDGWDSYYTGASTPASGVVQAVTGRRADVLAISATITHYVADVERLIGLVRRQPDCAGLKIIVGGFPFNQTPGLWQRVGADGSAADAETAVALANRLLDQSGARR